MIGGGNIRTVCMPPYPSEDAKTKIPLIPINFWLWATRVLSPRTGMAFTYLLVVILFLKNTGNERTYVEQKVCKTKYFVFFKCLAFGEMQFSGENQRMRASNKTLSPSLSLAQEAAPPIRCFQASPLEKKRRNSDNFFCRKLKFYGKVPIFAWTPMCAGINFPLYAKFKKIANSCRARSKKGRERRRADLSLFPETICINGEEEE